MNSFFTKNLTLKIVSICFAFIMWIVVMREVNPQVTESYSNIPVQLAARQDLQQQGLVILGEDSPTISVNLRGRRDEINKISRNDVRAVADLRGFKAGVVNVPVEVSPIGNVDIDFSPKNIRLELENIIRVQKDITLIINGSPTTGYIYGEPQYKPTVVWIEGPESKADTVTRVIATLDTGDATEGITASLPLRALTSQDAEVAVEVKPTYVDVFLPIDRLKTVRLEADIQATSAEGYMVTGIQLQPEQASVRGKHEDVALLTELYTDKIVFDNLTESFEVEVPIIIPERVELLDDTPVKAQITVEKLEEEIFTLNKNNITFVNITEGFQVDRELLAEEYEVRIVAPRRILNNISERTIRLIINLEELQLGQHQVQAEIDLPQSIAERIETMEVIPPEISITIISD